MALLHWKFGPNWMEAASAQTVLVVDDRKDVAVTLAEMCRACGFDAEVAEDGVGMLGLLQRHRPSCVIVDVMMPDQDGYEAMKDIARFDPSLPVMLVTGHGDVWLQMGVTLGRAQGLTAVHTATKPVRVHAVRAFLETVASR
ncbi:response regulator [Limobrevibacterium gyesilva]|nr:response regulator [Limobrevibacterium gyesilva]